MAFGPHFEYQKPVCVLIMSMNKDNESPSLIAPVNSSVPEPLLGSFIDDRSREQLWGVCSPVDGLVPSCHLTGGMFSLLFLLVFCIFLFMSLPVTALDPF